MTKEVFLSSFFTAQKNVQEAKMFYQDRIELNMIIKDFYLGTEKVFSNIWSIDPFLPRRYTQGELEKLL